MSMLLGRAKSAGLPPIKMSVRQLARHASSRRILNACYNSLSFSQKHVFWRIASKLFRGDIKGGQEGVWRVRFLGETISLPLSPERFWQEWDSALSIVGNDIDVKSTYAALLQSQQRPDIFIDAGANYGLHSLIFLKMGVRTISIEPNPACHDYFRKICALNNVDPKLVACALGRIAGQARLTFDPAQTWNGRITSPGEDLNSDQSGSSEVSVDICTLDSLTANIGKANILIKIDVEGYELEALNGAVELISRHRPYIIFESHPDSGRHALYEFFDAQKYNIRNLPYILEEPSPKLSLTDFVAAPTWNFISLPE